MYYKDHQEFEDVRNQFDSKRVLDNIDRTKLQKVEIIDNFDKYIKTCMAQLEIITHTKIKKYVYFNRRQNYGTKRIEYFTGVMNYPDIPDHCRFEWTEAGTGKTFGGKERKAAETYAGELAKEYRCEIRK